MNPEETNELPENRIDLSEIKASAESLKTELRKVLVGQKDMLELLLISLLVNGHILIEGVPGIAKTLTAKLLARTLNIDFSRIQFTPDLMPSDVIGTNIYNNKSGEFEFHKGPIFSNLVLIDEINRAPAKTQAALFESMEERQVSVDGQTYTLDEPFIVVATQNPIEQEGTYRLPEAQLDRFIFKITMDYPSLEEEIQILQEQQKESIKDAIEKVNSILQPDQILRFRELIRQVRIEENQLNYIAKIVQNTRNNPSLYLGASPRASLAIVHASKASAALDGRDFITPDDIHQLVYPVLRHRIILSPEREMEGIGADEIIRQIVHGIEIPR